MKKCKAEDMTIVEASRFLKIHIDELYEHIESGTVICKDGYIKKEFLNEIKNLRERNISIVDYLKKYDNERFQSKFSKNREKYIDFLEENDYFGLQILEPEKLLFITSKTYEFYISKEDIAFLDYKSQKFFDNYGLSEKEKISKIISKTKSHIYTKKYLRLFIKQLSDEDNLYTPSLTEFVQIIFEMPDILQVNDNDILTALESLDTKKAKKLLIDFFSYGLSQDQMKYHSIKFKKNEGNSVKAYSYDEYITLAKILFNETYDKDHNLTQRALENSTYAEMWLFLSCHYVCGWRSSDICTYWVYPNLTNNDNPFNLNVYTLKEDILQNNIDESVYKQIALYSIRRIEMSYNIPQKTGKGKLRSEIVPELQTFFGKLILIAEYHHINSGEGYMKAYRTSKYRNWILCKEFFGEDIFSITGKQSISSLRLNKSYLQGMELTARENGNSSLVSHVIASYARNHTNINTTLIYLKDHGLTGEKAEIVLFMMMQRGVFGVSLYHALLTAFPHAFESLTMQEQTSLMEKFPLSAFELESLGSVFSATEDIAEELSKANTDLPMIVLKSMLAIGQGKGKAKDKGIFCIKKALGYSCEYPLYESCLANLCPYFVFTRDGIPALINVIKNYAEKAQTRKKYEIALKKYIIPAFQYVINEISKEMSAREQASTRKLIEEILNG